MLTLLRWIARLLATAAAGLFIAFLVTGNAPDIRDLTDAELFGIGATGVMTVGALLGWRWDLLGAALLLAGYTALALVDNGWPTLAFAPFLFAGVVLLISGLVKRFRPKPAPEAEMAG